MFKLVTIVLLILNVVGVVLNVLGDAPALAFLNFVLALIMAFSLAVGD